MLRDHLAWLNEASSRIGTTLDLERTAQELVEFTVPRLADGAAIDLLESVLRGEEGAPVNSTQPTVTRAIAVAAVDALANLEPDPVGEISDYQERAVDRCLTEREPVLIARLGADDYIRVAATPRAAALLREAGVHSYLAVPLVSRGVLLGAADFIRSGSTPPFTDTDLALAMQLASRAAVFLDNARLYGQERERLVALQRSMLPRAMPSTPGLDVAAHYAPPTETSGVGGDWYDVVALPGGRSALIVGDVMNHGLSAAATMGRLRTVARTLMALDIAPERALARMDLAARDLDDDQVATCLCAVYDPATREYTLASAGHPPPLLVDAAGRATHVDVPPGAPLGTGVIPYTSVRLPAPAGSRLVLYTDGLFKNRTDDVDAQLERLRDTVSRTDPTLLSTLVSSGTGPGTRFDEAVLLMATGRPVSGAADIVVWELPPDARAASVARRLVREQLDRWNLGGLVDTTELVVSELVGNALRYGGGPGQLRLLRHDRVTVEVTDTGADLPHIQPPTLSDEGGRGLQLINMLCRRWGSCRTPTGKLVWAEQDITVSAAD
ncbi:SpoIIE family protein phosphatase [Streptomyces anulatus]|uniref:ATP-binding SpoIIE family protein phosphatase n=1 Tax=Streptomyces anulatus TaxID=1892 RepID=UPI00366117DA